MSADKTYELGVHTSDDVTRDYEDAVKQASYATKSNDPRYVGCEGFLRELNAGKGPIDYKRHHPEFNESPGLQSRHRAYAAHQKPFHGHIFTFAPAFISRAPPSHFAPNFNPYATPPLCCSSPVPEALEKSCHPSRNQAPRTFSRSQHNSMLGFSLPTTAYPPPRHGAYSNHTPLGKNCQQCDDRYDHAYRTAPPLYFRYPMTTPPEEFHRRRRRRHTISTPKIDRETMPSPLRKLRN